MIKLKDLLVEADPSRGSMNHARRMEMLKRIAKVGRVSWKRKNYDASVTGNNIRLTAPNRRTSIVSSLIIWNWEMMHPPKGSVVKLIPEPERDPNLAHRPSDYRL